MTREEVMAQASSLAPKGKLTWCEHGAASLVFVTVGEPPADDLRAAFVTAGWTRASERAKREAGVETLIPVGCPSFTKSFSGGRLLDEGPLRTVCEELGEGNVWIHHWVQETRIVVQLGDASGAFSVEGAPADIARKIREWVDRIRTA